MSKKVVNENMKLEVSLKCQKKYVYRKCVIYENKIEHKKPFNDCEE